MTGWKFDIRFSPFNDRLSVYSLVRGERSGEGRAIKPAEIEPRDEGLIPEPWLDLQYEEGRDLLQGIVDACWTHGIQPSQLADNAAANDAQAKHLEDMRTITFHKLGIKS